MMLQQQTHARLWGWAKGGSTVEVTTSWDTQTYRATADKQTGRWELQVSTPAASYDPQSLTIKGDGETRRIENVLIGEVWFCSGQSNMRSMVLLGPIEYGDASQRLLELPCSRCQRRDCLFGALPSQHTCSHHREKGCLGATGPCARWMEGVRAEECRQFLGLRLLFCTSPDRHPRRTRGHHQLLLGWQLRRRLVTKGDPPHLP